MSQATTSQLLVPVQPPRSTSSGASNTIGTLDGLPMSSTLISSSVLSSTSSIGPTVSTSSSVSFVGVGSQTLHQSSIQGSTTVTSSLPSALPVTPTTTSTNGVSSTSSAIPSASTTTSHATSIEPGFLPILLCAWIGVSFLFKH